MKQRREGAYLCRYLRLNEKRNPFLADSFLAVRTGLEPVKLQRYKLDT